MFGVLILGGSLWLRVFVVGLGANGVLEVRVMLIVLYNVVWFGLWSTNSLLLDVDAGKNQGHVISKWAVLPELKSGQCLDII